MSKYDFIKSRNIVPVHKVYTWEYEVDYEGKVEKLEMKIYPFTVEEKLKIQTMSEDGSKLYKSKNPEERARGEKMLADSAELSALTILKKDDPEITAETIARLPSYVKTDIFYMALEFEGIKREVIEEKVKKEISEL